MVINDLTLTNQEKFFSRQNDLRLGEVGGFFPNTHISVFDVSDVLMFSPLLSPLYV